MHIYVVLYSMYYIASIIACKPDYLCNLAILRMLRVKGLTNHLHPAFKQCIACTHRSISSCAGSHRALAAAPRMGLGNSFGRLFRISTWGESHGGGVGVTLDGCPPKLPITREDIQIGKCDTSLIVAYLILPCSASITNTLARC